MPRNESKRSKSSAGRAAPYPNVSMELDGRTGSMTSPSPPDRRLTVNGPFSSVGPVYVVRTGLPSKRYALIRTNIHARGGTLLDSLVNVNAGDQITIVTCLDSADAVLKEIGWRRADTRLDATTIVNAEWVAHVIKTGRLPKSDAFTLPVRRSSAPPHSHATPPTFTAAGPVAATASSSSPARSPQRTNTSAPVASYSSPSRPGLMLDSQMPASSRIPETVLDPSDNSGDSDSSETDARVNALAHSWLEMHTARHHAAPAVAATIPSTASPHGTAAQSRLPRSHWQCLTPFSARTPNLNKHITDQLEILLRRHEIGSDEASKWRALGYRKAISAIRQFPEKINSIRQIEGAKLTGVGEKILPKIEQILRTGTCDAVKNKPGWEDSVFMFMKIHGVGPSTAREWYYKGYRTLEDVRGDAKGLVSRQQKIGLKYFKDLGVRIPREEVTDAFETVARIAKIVVPGIELHCMGSYRRGAVTSGDIDIILTHPNPPLNRGMHPLTAVVTQLTCAGFLIDDLIQGPFDTKYMGVCRLPRPGSRPRRLDLLWVPYDELGASLLYFTGSDIFNRSMRLLARKMGLSLNQHGLYEHAVRRKGEEVTEGRRTAGRTEQEVFERLGIPYLDPRDRNA